MRNCLALTAARVYALRQRAHELLVGNCLQPAAAGVLGSARHVPRLPKLEPGILQPVLLLVEYHLTPLIPTGAIDLRGDRQGFAVWGETPHASAFSRDVFQQHPSGEG
jgi:hypothetical protein